MAEKLREPNRDCILYMSRENFGRERCCGLNELYCATDLNGCPYYKSKNEYDSAGRPIRKG